MAEDGLDQISNGILYTQHKDSTSSPGAAVVPDRYYIPAFHEFRSLSQTDLILHRHPELICTCPICKETMGSDPDKIILFDDEPELLRKHFLCVRESEVERVNTIDKSDLLIELATAHKKYHKTVSTLPNPDAVMSSNPMKGLEYLEQWVEALK